MEELNPDIEVIWGLYDDNSLDTDVQFTIIATGFETEERVNSIPEEPEESKETPEPIDSPIDSTIASPYKPSLAERLLQRFGYIIDEMTRDE